MCTEFLKSLFFEILKTLSDTQKLARYFLDFEYSALIGLAWSHC